LIEYATLQEAKSAVKGANGEKLLEQTIEVDFAFVRPPPNKGGHGGGRGRPSGGARRGRSRSPGAGAERGRDED
jgi:RNA-binding protein 8A